MQSLPKPLPRPPAPCRSSRACPAVQIVRSATAGSTGDPPASCWAGQTNQNRHTLTVDILLASTTTSPPRSRPLSLMAPSEPRDVGAYFREKKPQFISLSTPNTERAGERSFKLWGPIFSSANGIHVTRSDAISSYTELASVGFPCSRFEAWRYRCEMCARCCVTRVYGYLYMHPFHGISMELHQMSVFKLVRSEGVMPLEQVADLGKVLVCICCAHRIWLNQLRPSSDLYAKKRPHDGHHSW